MAEYNLTETGTKILRAFPITIENNTIYVKIPLDKVIDLVEKTKGVKKEESSTPIKSINSSIFISQKVRDTYENDTDGMIEDVTEFLRIVSECWAYHNGSYQKSILKKACGKHPKLNSILFDKYKTGADAILENIIKQNLNIIKSYWG